MREEEFKAWLAENGANTATGRNTRTHAVRTIENNLAALGSPHSDLDAAWADDQFAQLRNRITQIRENYDAGGEDFRILMPNSENPQSRLSNWRSWLAQYGRYLREMPKDNSDADRIRRYVLEAYIEPAREQDQTSCEFVVKNINDALALNAAWPNICQAVTGKKFLELADVPPPQRYGAPQSTATRYVFDTQVEDYWAMRLLRQRFGEPFNLAKKMAAFQLPDGRHLALDLEQSSPQIWLEGHLSPPVPIKAEHFAADKSRHSGLPSRLKPGNAATKAMFFNLDELGAVIERYLNSTPDNSDDTKRDAPTMPNPTNLILYGPPGTGKTYTTAHEAVTLCDGSAPADRDELMARYRELVEAKRIDFVTFHQNFSYEDFVEGLRPETGETEGGAGFRLEPKSGVFRDICRRAADAVESAKSGPPFDIGGRQIFKMSLGRPGIEDHVFETAIEDGCILFNLGGDIDWSPFGTYEAIRDRWNVDHPGTNGNNANIIRMTSFRAYMKEGDLVIISQDGKRVDAIVEVTGRYEFAPDGVAGFPHKRAVKWLRIYDEPMAFTDFYAGALTRANCIYLSEKRLNRPALAAMLPGDGPAAVEPKHYVLIIDEINRANISKVFGELITLLEPDKRLGMENALTVRLPYSRKEFGVPANLHIIGTMNTADRSIALLDTALRRRFIFKEMAPEPALLKDAAANTGLPLVKMLTTINERVEYLAGREHRIGHAFFMGCKSKDDVHSVMRHKVIPLLQEYFFDDWKLVHAVLGGGFIGSTTLKDPTGENREDRKSWYVMPLSGADEAFPDNAYLALADAKVPAPDNDFEEDVEPEAAE